MLLRSSLLFLLAAPTAFAEVQEVTEGTTEGGIQWRLIDDEGVAQSGRHVPVPDAGGSGVWIVDTATGDVKLCWLVSEAEFVGDRPTFTVDCAKATQ